MKAGIQVIDRQEIAVPGARRLLLIGDAGCTGFDEECRSILGGLLAHDADLVFLLGDLTVTGTPEEFRDIIGFCGSRSRAPLFALCGNHDMLHYEEFLGLSSYALLLEHHLCIFLSGLTGRLGEREFTFLADVLERHRDRQVLLLMHIPPPTAVHGNHMSREEWESLRAVLEPHRERVARIICGHLHGYYEYEIDGYAVTITAGGGALMIYDLKAPARRIHHALGVELLPNGGIRTELLLPADSPGARDLPEG